MYISNYEYLNSDISNQKTYRIKMCMRVNPPSVVMLLYSFLETGGWSSGAMVLGKFPVPGRPTIWMKVGQGPLCLQ